MNRNDHDYLPTKRECEEEYYHFKMNVLQEERDQLQEEIERLSLENDKMKAEREEVAEMLNLIMEIFKR